MSAVEPPLCARDVTAKAREGVGARSSIPSRDRAACAKSIRDLRRYRVETRAEHFRFANDACSARRNFMASLTCLGAFAGCEGEGEIAPAGSRRVGSQEWIRGGEGGERGVRHAWSSCPEVERLHFFVTRSVADGYWCERSSLMRLLLEVPAKTANQPEVGR